MKTPPPSQLQREAWLVVPAVLAMLVILSAFVLFSYRSSLEAIAEHRRREAERLARPIAAALARRSAISALDHRPPSVAALAIVDQAGRPLVSHGDLDLVPPPPPGEALTRGPDSELPDRIVTFLPLEPATPPRHLRLELDVSALGHRLLGVRRLTPLVLGAEIGLGILLLLFLRRFFAPYGRLLAQLPRDADDPPSAEEEIRFLLATFERALAASGQLAEDVVPTAEGSVAASLESGWLLLDADRRVLALNPAGAELLALSPPAPRTPLALAFADRPRFVEALVEALDGPPDGRVHEIAEVADGGHLELGLAVHALRGSGGAERGYLVLFAEWSTAGRRAADARLADSLAQLGELAAGVAHELRNGLATLTGYLSLHRRDGSSEHLEEVQREAEHLTRVVRDFLAFARPGTARLGPVDLAALLGRVVADPILAAAPVELDLRTEEGMAVHGDEELLRQALVNLVLNAVQADPERPPTVRSLVTDDGTIEVQIADRGPGLPGNVRDRLFEPFACGRPGGVGLGLALSRRLLRLHRAELLVEDRQGGGTTVRVRIRRDTIATEGSTAAENARSTPPSPN